MQGFGPCGIGGEGTEKEDLAGFVETSDIDVVFLDHGVERALEGMGREGEAIALIEGIEGGGEGVAEGGEIDPGEGDEKLGV